MRFGILLALLLAGCAATPKQYLTSERDDDKTCRAYMKNKRAGNDDTYADCRRSLVDFANNPPIGVAAPSNVTVIVNQ